MLRIYKTVWVFTTRIRRAVHTFVIIGKHDAYDWY